MLLCAPYSYVQPSKGDRGAGFVDRDWVGAGEGLGKRARYDRRQAGPSRMAGSAKRWGRDGDARHLCRRGHRPLERLHAIDTWSVDGRRRSVECLSSFLLAPHAAGGDWLCGLDRYRCGGHRDLGMVLLNDPVAPMRILCIGLILAGVIGLKLVSGM
jgi:hypothetical protein